MRVYYNLTYNNNLYNICIDNTDPSGIGCINEIFIKNEYILENFYNIKSHIIDIGANCGLASIILAKQNPDSIIYSFEPDIKTYELLEENVRINSLKNVKTFNLAVSDNCKKHLVLYNHPQFSGGNTTCSDEMTIQLFFDSKINSYKVDCISLDEIINKFGINNIELLKIDCEGAEYEIIYNSKYFKDNIVKNIVGEFHNLKYNSNADNNNIKLVEYCKNYVSGILKITLLTI